MSINKTAQFNWFRRLKDRNRNNNEGGQELSFNEQELRGLQDVERRNADAERQRADSLVEESRKRTEKAGMPTNIPGTFELSSDSVMKVDSMEPNALWSALCASFENCSPYVSEDTAYRGRLIGHIVESKNSSAAGWGKMLEGIKLLLHGLEIDVMNLAVNNRLEEGSYEWAKRVFTNKEWLYENRITLQRAITFTAINKPSSIFKNIIEYPRGRGEVLNMEALIKLWALWYKKYYYYEQFEISFYIEHRESAWLQFRSYIKEKQAENMNITGVALSKKYLPAEMQTINDGVHDVETNIFNLSAGEGWKSFRKWDIEKWKSFIRDMHLMMDVAGIELK